jgi:hypothetical protein
MKVKTHLKAGGIAWNHNQTLVRDRDQGRKSRKRAHAKRSGLRVKTHLKAGGINLNHNQTLICDSGKEVTGQ